MGYNRISGILIQYLLTIANVVVWLVILLVRCEGLESILVGWNQLLVALSSNICSIACTICFLMKYDEDATFQDKRSMIIMLSVIPNVVLTFLSALEVSMAKSRNVLVLLVMSLIIVVALVMMIRMQVFVGDKNESRKRELSERDQSVVENVKKQDNAIVGDEKFFIKGE